MGNLYCKNEAFYRIVAAGSHTPRDGKHLQVGGFYDPLAGVKEGLKGHIVVELSDLDNEVLVKRRRQYDSPWESYKPDISIDVKKHHKHETTMDKFAQIPHLLLLPETAYWILGMERKSTQRLYCSKVCRKDIILWLQTRHGRYDYGFSVVVANKCVY
ncbi:hypothetical protein OIU78_023052 [Salix suchowensis]|nr:hypothetical protein OIU78_023052 [Salix suchowensis]